MQWRTPTVGALVEAAHYFEGAPVVYGKTRWSPPIAHRTELGRHSRVSHQDSYTGGTPDRLAGCTDDDLSNAACDNETIVGSPVYTSPIKTECQANHLILVTDGESSTDKPAVARGKQLVLSLIHI